MTEAGESSQGARPWAAWELPVLLLTLATALVLRLSGYAQVPPVADNGDEFDWSWQGLGLLTKGVPYGWSNLRLYPPGTTVTLNGKFFEIVHPYLDHPPVFGLLAGASAWLLGARELTAVTVGLVRPVPIACSLVALALAYVLGRGVIGAEAAMTGVALLASSPAAVVVQRQVEAEALLAPLLLAAMIMLQAVMGPGPRRWPIGGLLACCAIAPMVKVSGVAVAGVAAAILVAEGRWSLAVSALAAGLAGILGFFLYGAFYDWHLFAQVLAGSAGRRYGLMGVYEFFVAPAGPGGANQSLRDGWWLLGCLGLGAVLVLRRRQFAQLGWPILGYAAVIMLFAEHVSYYGWFRVAVYPLVYLLAGWLAWRAAGRGSALAALALLTVGVAPVLNALYSGGRESWAPNPYLLLAALAVALVPPLVAQARRTETTLTVARAAGAAVVAVALGLNLAASLNLDTIYRSL